MMKEIYALGVGGSTPGFLEIAEICGYHISGFYHYNSKRTGEIDHCYPILGSFDDLFASNIEGVNFLLTMGDNEIREEIFNKIKDRGGIIPSLVHPSAIVSRFAQINTMGVVVGPFVEIQADVIIEANVLIRTGGIICHNTVVMKNCFIGPKALVGAHTILHQNVFVGQGAIVVSGKVNQIGRYSLVGAGSLVIKEIPENVIVAGNPAQLLRKRFE